MMTEGYFVHTYQLVGLVLKAYEIQPGPVYRAAGIQAEELRNPNDRVPAAKMEKLLSGLVEATGDTCVGLRFAEFLHPSNLGALGYAWLASSTLRSSLQRLVRYHRLFTPHRRCSLINDGREWKLSSLYLGPGATLSIRSDAAMAVVTKISRWHLGESATPLYVELQRPRPNCVRRHEAFFGCPVRYDAERDTVAFTATMVDKPLPGANPEIARLNEALLQQYLPRLGEDPLAGQVKSQIIMELPSGEVRLDSVARAMNLSARSLQRHLGEHGARFRDLVEATRREIAEFHLRDPNLCITEIAFRVGYADTSAFSKAVRHWTGLSPSQYRDHMLDPTAE